MAEEGGSSGGSVGAGAVFIKRINKIEGGHHGGAWKIAYADFVTAMMAFFLLLWLLNSVTQEQLEGISNYFAPASIAPTTSGAGGVAGGQTISAPGSEVSARAKASPSLDLPPPKTGLGGEDQSPSAEQQSEEEATAEQVKRAEETQFEEAQQQLQQAIQENPNAPELEKSLVVDNTPEGLRIQIVDQEGLAMFSSGGFDPLPRAIELLTLVKDVVIKMPQKIAISGHTDAVKFGAGAAYTNWELSVDRANSARRVLISRGLPESRVNRVVGKAATEPLDLDNPKSPRNRRLSIVLLRGTGGEADAEGEEEAQEERR